VTARGRFARPAAGAPSIGPRGGSVRSVPDSKDTSTVDDVRYDVVGIGNALVDVIAPSA